MMLSLEQIANLPESEQIELLALLELEEKERKSNLYKTTFESFYPWQLAFTKATSEYYECCLCAANQIGKSYTGTALDALHLLGDYPDDYEGHKFDFAPVCWALGFSMEKTRDLLQTKLFGSYTDGEFVGGLVPKDKILRWESASGTSNAMRTVWVQHALGVSLIQFWSYSQGQHAIMGDLVDWVHVDEEPRDQSIRPQLLTRTVNGDRGKGGRIIYTFTPENGRTDLVIQFMDTPSPSQFFMQKGWNDAPHMTEEKKTRLLVSYPEHQRDMRTEGIPMLGHGRVYDIADEFVMCDPFSIPDHWFVINAMDFGWDHPQAQCQLVHDRDNDVIYVTHSWKMSKVSADDARGATKHWAKNIPFAWPHDGLQQEKGRADSLQLKEHYQKAGFNMLYEKATFINGSNSVENGLFEIIGLMRKGKFKIFKGQPDLMEEFRQYHRVECGHINKSRDDILDAMRYAYMMLRYAVRYGEEVSKKAVILPASIRVKR